MSKIAKFKLLGLIKSFVINNKIISITQHLKLVKSKIEKLISLSKNYNSLGITRTIRLIRSEIKCNRNIAFSIIDLSVKFKNISSGYTKILRLGKRRGDGAHLSVLLPSNILQSC